MYIYQIMSNNFGYLDIILLGMIAGFIILRLRSILGRKTGHETKVYPNFAEKKFSMPQKDIKAAEQNLEILEGKDKKEFLKGAEIAYESILTSFASGDLIKLKALLSPNMFSNFSDAIKSRNKDNIKSEFTFIGVKESSVEKYEKIKQATAGHLSLSLKENIQVDLTVSKRSGVAKFDFSESTSGTLIIGSGINSSESTKIKDALADDLPLLVRDGNFIRSGFDLSLDSLRNLSKKSRDHMVLLQQKYSEETAITSLKIKYNNSMDENIINDNQSNSSTDDLD